MCLEFEKLCLFFFVSADGGGDSFPEPAADTMLEFKLKVKCKHNFRAPKGSEDPKELYQHSNGENLYIMPLHRRGNPPKESSTCGIISLLFFPFQ